MHDVMPLVKANTLFLSSSSSGVHVNRKAGTRSPALIYYLSLSICLCEDKVHASVRRQLWYTNNKQVTKECRVCCMLAAIKKETDLGAGGGGAAGAGGRAGGRGGGETGEN